MSTTKQRAANAANAQHSTGPRSPEAKAAVRGNATRHGLTSRMIVIPGEDPEAFESLKAELAAGYRPANFPEQVLVDQIAENLWRLLRARGIETSTFQISMMSTTPVPRPPGGCQVRVPVDEVESAARCFHDNAHEFDNLRRYEAAIERSYYRAIDHLLKLQKERRLTEEKQTPNREIGIVSQMPQPDPVETMLYRAAAPAPVPTIGFPSREAQSPGPDLVPSH